MRTRARQIQRAMRIGLAWMTGLAICVNCFSDAAARGPSVGRGGGGGARPSGGARPGGGARPSGGMSRPSGGMSRPSAGMSRPSGGMSRPSGGVSRPSGIAGGASRPSMPANRPSLGNVGSSRPNLPNNSRPNIGNASRPSLGGIGGSGLSRPGIGSVSPPPSFGGGSGFVNSNRPSLGNIGDRPGAIQLPSNRPGTGGIAGSGDRPGTGNRPGIGDRPGVGDRPGIGPRPENPIAGNRPGIGDRPGIGNRPGIGDRPIIGGGNRPGNGNIIIGGGNNIIGGGNNIGNNWGINNRPGGDWWSQNHNGNWNNHWHDNWHDHCINDRYGWYNGCWNNNWGGGWYAPLATGAMGWGLGSWYSGYAYGDSGYYNPYYTETVAASAVPYDYSQPVTVNYYAPTDDSASATAPNVALPPQNDAAQAQFDRGLAEFKAGRYPQALTQFDAALRQLPSDPVVHEVRALNLFALGQYQQAAASLNALLATAPGMDWTTMSGLYGNVEDYKQQLRALEDHCKANRTDAPAAFVLAYHYLIGGHQEAATNALKAVVRQQPKDVIAKRMLDSLAPPSATSVPTVPPVADPATNVPQTDLVGTWTAKAGDAVIDLTIGEDSQFAWKATQKGKPALQIQGGLTASSDTLILESKTQGSMVGRVKSVSPDKWQFAMAGGNANDAQLTFERAKKGVER